MWDNWFVQSPVQNLIPIRLIKFIVLITFLYYNVEQVDV